MFHSILTISHLLENASAKSLNKVYEHQSSLTMYAVDKQTKSSKLQTKFIS